MGTYPFEKKTTRNVRDRGLRSRTWKRFLQGPDPALLEELYVPALAEAVRYDRCCAYFSSSVLAAAARGFGRLIERLEALGESSPRPAIRLLVNEELAAEDVQALTERGDLAVLEASLKRRFKTPQDALEKARLKMLAWLAKRGLLEVRVGVMRRGGGVLHAKFGIVTDLYGDSLVFRGSGNESAQGLLSNYEHLEVSTSWEDPAAHRHYAEQFELLWRDEHPDVHTVPLPEAVRLQLIRFAPEEPPLEELGAGLERQKAAMIWRFITEAPYLPNGASACDATAMVDPWPHQRNVVAEVAAAWPEGRLLCDEVGMGKTIEAVLVIRRLMAGRGVGRLLILVPAGLLRQWQAELREKGGLIVPRLEGLNTLVWPDDRMERVRDLAQALEQDFLLMSRETARTEDNLPVLLAARPWDLVILDEAHAARRRKQEEGEFNSGTLLLTLLRELQLRRRARGFLLLSATPMQTHPWEPWDLLAVLGEGGRWLAEFGVVRDYYGAIASLQTGTCDLATARRAAATIAADERIGPPGWDQSLDPRDPRAVAEVLVFSPPERRANLVRWLRQVSPLSRRMHRNTRGTLHRYFELGLLEVPPPRREIVDVVFDFKDATERDVYEAVKGYIDRRYALLEQEKPGKGFVMTIYRRRAASSPQALRRSLERRREGLLRVIHKRAVDPYLVDEEADPRDLDDLGEYESVGRISAAYPSDPEVARAELEEVEKLLAALDSLNRRDSKRDYFFDVLRKVSDDGRPVLVFTEYADTMEYIRDNLVAAYGTRLGCYSGRGGERWDGSEWKHVDKAEIACALRDGELLVLVCTDAASEGLNLQAAGAVINYDLPWNPSKVEQRIGRVDRIGQKWPVVRVVNLFLADSVDEKVYNVLRHRCGLFQHFVGAMQPVLARARRMLLGQEAVDTTVLEEEAAKAEQDHLTKETYLDGDVAVAAGEEPPVVRADLEEALQAIPPESGITVRRKGTRFTLSGPGLKKAVVSVHLEDLERDHTILPLTPECSVARTIAGHLSRPWERHPLVIGSCQRGAFRVSVACWVSSGGVVPIRTLRELKELLKKWSGESPDPGAWLAAQKAAEVDARRAVEEMLILAEQRQARGLAAQREAARERLLRELGRYLACLGGGTQDLNGLLHAMIQRGGAVAQRLLQAYQRLGGYPVWPDELVWEVSAWVASLTENHRQARLLGRELDAALQDPRWVATAV